MALLDYLLIERCRTIQIENRTGYQDEVDQQLAKEVSSLRLPESRKIFGILLDEMKIKEGLVYNKHSGKIIGFTDLGDINDDLLRLEQEEEHPDVAKYVLAVMVRGTLCTLMLTLGQEASQQTYSSL